MRDQRKPPWETDLPAVGVPGEVKVGFEPSSLSDGVGAVHEHDPAKVGIWRPEIGKKLLVGVLAVNPWQTNQLGFSTRQRDSGHFAVHQLHSPPRDVATQEVAVMVAQDAVDRHGARQPAKKPLRQRDCRARVVFAFDVIACEKDGGCTATEESSEQLVVSPIPPGPEVGVRKMNQPDAVQAGVESGDGQLHAIPLVARRAEELNGAAPFQA